MSSSQHIVRSLVTVMLFAGLGIIMHSVYEERLQRAQKQVRVEYRFLPRTLYEEQMSQESPLTKFKSMFD